MSLRLLTNLSNHLIALFPYRFILHWGNDFRLRVVSVFVEKNSHSSRKCWKVNLMVNNISEICKLYVARISPATFLEVHRTLLSKVIFRYFPPSRYSSDRDKVVLFRFSFSTLREFPKLSVCSSLFSTTLKLHKVG